MYEYRSNDPRYKGFNFSSGAKVTVIKAPQHGDVAVVDNPLGQAHHWYHYMPTDKGYSGRDRFEVLVEKEDVQIRIFYFIEVLDEYDTPTGRCQYGHRKISSTTFNPGTQDYAAWLRSSELSTLLATASQSLTGFQDLAGSSVGQTTGSGTTAQITLDTTAAGHGWYVDPTPLDNTDEFLPTSNPNLWQAKAGSAAEGKMDMLSVLLHEYGHALGLEHSADSADYMAATLQPGQRRLPSADELTLMSPRLFEPGPSIPLRQQFELGIPATLPSKPGDNHHAA